MLHQPRNPDLLASWKTGLHDKRYGHRVMYFEGRACPNEANRCSICEKNTADTVGMHFFPAQIADFEQPLRALVDDINRPEMCNHRWLTQPSQAVWGAETYVEGVDYSIVERRITWLGVRHPPKGAVYTLQYRAYVEHNISLQHVVTGVMGEKSHIEESRFLPTGIMEQGGIIASIPPDSALFDIQMGELIVPADATMTFSQKIDMLTPVKRSRHRWVSRIKSAYYLSFTGTNPDDPDEVEEVEAEVSFDPYNRLWVVTNPPDECERITVTYIATPVYLVTTDLGEFRSPVNGQQARLISLARTELYI